MFRTGTAAKLGRLENKVAQLECTLTDIVDKQITLNDATASNVKNINKVLKLIVTKLEELDKK